MELARISHPFVNEDQARPVFIEEFAQNVARTRGSLIVGADAIESFLSAELPSKLAPQGTDNCAVGFFDRVAGRDFVAYQYDALGAEQLLGVCTLQHGVNSYQVCCGRAREEMVKREHRMRFATAEVGLELHDR